LRKPALRDSGQSQFGACMLEIGMTDMENHLYLAGEAVEVKSAAEIAATLDAEGRLDGMPFMPEMLAFCGRKLKVSRRADKTCVEGFYGMRKLGGTVFLEEARCDGAAHRGCQRNCMMFWKDAWLKPAVDGQAVLVNDLQAEAKARRVLSSLPTKAGDKYACQSTLLGEITRPQSKWDVGHLVTDLRRAELSPVGFALMAGRTVVNRVRHVFGLPDLEQLIGDGDGKSKVALNLKPGDWVRIRSAEEIKATLGPDGRNLGLTFEPEMARYIGGTYEVDFPVRSIILEETGQMAKLNRTVALKTLACKGVCAKNCPRANTLYWREAWLERVEEAAVERKTA
jgi:hypothetical protein